MRISLKVLGVMWMFLFLVIGGLLYNAYSKLSPDAFVALLSEQVQRNYPGAELEVGNISYRFSLDFNLNLQKINLRRSGKILGSIGEVELKVPWWLLLTKRGNAHINISHFDVFIDHGSKVSPPVKSQLTENNIIKVSLPSYLADAKFTLRAKEVAVKDIHTGRRYFNVSKLLVREFQYGKNSAFELNIPVSTKLGETQYSSDLWLFGDITPDPASWDLNFRGEFRTKENIDNFQLEDLHVDGKAVFAPKILGITSEINLLIDKKPVGSGNLKVSQNSFSADFSLKDFPLNYLNFAFSEMKDAYLPDVKGNGEGSVSFQKDFSTGSATFQGKLGFEGNLQFTKENFIPGNWQIAFHDSKWELSFISPNGEASFFRRSILDLKKSKVTQYNEELGFSGLDLSIINAPIQKLPAFAEADSETYFATTISFNKCLLRELVLDGTFKYGSTPGRKFYTGELKDEKTSFNVSYTEKGPQKFLDVNFKNFKWDPAFHFLSPYFTAQNGIMDGKTELRWTDSWENGESLVQMNMKGMVEPQGRIPDFVRKTTSFFEVDSNTFNAQSLNISGKDGTFKVNSLMLEDPQSVKIIGSLNLNQKSFLNLTYPKNKKLKGSKKEIMEPYWLVKDDK